MAGNSRSGVLTAMLGVVAGLLLVTLGAAVTFIVVSGDSEPAAAPPATEIVVESAAPPPPVTTEPAYVPPAPSGSVVVRGGQCWESEVRSFGTSAAGESLVCTYMGANGGYVWVGHAANSGEVHNIGEPCNHPDDQVAVDPSGKAIMCGGPNSFWTDGP